MTKVTYSPAAYEAMSFSRHHAGRALQNHRDGWGDHFIWGAFYWKQSPQGALFWRKNARDQSDLTKDQLDALAEMIRQFDALNGGAE